MCIRLSAASLAAGLGAALVAALVPELDSGEHPANSSSPVIHSAMLEAGPAATQPTLDASAADTSFSEVICVATMLTLANVSMLSLQAGIGGR